MLSALLSVGGLSLDLAGAALLAYDALYGPAARTQASTRRVRLEIVRENHAQQERSLRALSRSASTSEETRERASAELAALATTLTETLAELRHWEKHELRAQRHAVFGLLLLLSGFACQAAGSVLTSGVPPI
jgi:hypothetical protein